VDDATFPDASRIGLWSKADAQSDFNDLAIVTEKGGHTLLVCTRLVRW
jgi:hypothetical protein